MGTWTNLNRSGRRAATGMNVAVNDEHDGLISLMVRDGSFRQVVAMIAETQKLNIVFAGPTDTVVTASFERQPWQTVLDSLTSASGHTWTTRGDVIFVSDHGMRPVWRIVNVSELLRQHGFLKAGMK